RRRKNKPGEIHPFHRAAERTLENAGGGGPERVFHHDPGRMMFERGHHFPQVFVVGFGHDELGKTPYHPREDPFEEQKRKRRNKQNRQQRAGKGGKKSGQPSHGRKTHLHSQYGRGRARPIHGGPAAFRFSFQKKTMFLQIFAQVGAARADEFGRHLLRPRGVPADFGPLQVVAVHDFVVGFDAFFRLAGIVFVPV